LLFILFGKELQLQWKKKKTKEGQEEEEGKEKKSWGLVVRKSSSNRHC